MQRTNIIELKPNKIQEKILQECMLLSSCVYNMTNYEVRQNIFKKEKVLNFFALQQKIQHTSQTCPICGIADSKHKKDRLFLCGFCGYFEHRDIVGATNILNNGMHSQQSVHQDEIILSRGVSLHRENPTTLQRWEY